MFIKSPVWNLKLDLDAFDSSYLYIIAIKSQIWEKDFHSLLIGSGLNNIFHWIIARLLLIFRSLFSSTVEQFLSLIFENSDVSSAKSLQIDLIPSSKSFIKIKNKIGPKAEPWGSPVKMFFHEEVCEFNRILCLSFR